MTLNPQALFSAQSAAREKAIDKFEAELMAGNNPAIKNYLLGHAEDRLTLLAELAHTELAFRIKTDGEFRVESFLHRFPELSSNRNIWLGLIVAEFQLRRRHHHTVSIRDYEIRFEAMGDSLAEALQSSLNDEEKSTLRTEGGFKKESPTESIDSDVSTVSENFGRFVIIGELGRGAFSTVYEAHEPKLDRNVALKIPRQDGNYGREELERFLREGRSVAQLQHPNIVPVFEAGEVKGRLYIASELVKGRTFREVLRSGSKMDQTTATTFVAKLAEALHAAHSKGIIHRDVKPENIMLDEAGEPYIMDFGLAKRKSDGVLRTGTGAFLGTPAYMSPEQAEGRSHLADARSDLWSLGVIFYELLTNRRPFEGEIHEVLKKIVSDEPVRLRAIDSSVSKDLETVCHKCLQKNPRHRYASCQHLADDLHRTLRNEVTLARPVNLVESARRWCFRNRVTAISGIAVIAALVTGLIVTSFALHWANREKGRADDNFKVARKQSEVTLSTLTSVVKDIQKGLENVPGAGEIRRRLLATSLDNLQNVANQFLIQSAVDQTTCYALLDLGDVVLQFGVDDSSGSSKLSSDQKSAVELARTLYSRAHAIAKQSTKISNVAVDLQILAVTKEKLGLVNLQLGKVQDALGLFEQQLSLNEQCVALDAHDKAAQRALSTALLNLGDIKRVQLGKLDQALDDYERGLKISRLLAEADAEGLPAQRDLAVWYERLATICVQLGQLEKALKNSELALAIDKTLFENDPSDIENQRRLSIACENMGIVSLQMGQTNDALNYQQQSLDLRKEMSTNDPKDFRAKKELSVAYQKLGQVYFQLNNNKRARDCHNESVAIERELTDADPTNAEAQRGLAIALENLGDANLILGSKMKALDSYSLMNKTFEKLADSDRSDMQAQRDLAISFAKLAMVNSNIGRTEEALKFSKKQLAIAEKLADVDRTDFRAQRDLYAALQNMGDIHLKISHKQEALGYYERMIAITRRLTQQEPNDIPSLLSMWRAHASMGDIHNLMGDKKKALKHYQQMLEMAEKAAQVAQGDALAQNSLSLGFQIVADHYVEMGNDEDANKHYAMSIEHRRKLLKGNPGDSELQRTLSDAYDIYGNRLLNLKQFNNAAECYRNMISTFTEIEQLQQPTDQTQLSLSTAYERLGDLSSRNLGNIPEAITWYTKKIQITESVADDNPTNREAQRDLANSHERLGAMNLLQYLPNEALAHYQQALDIYLVLAKQNPQDAQARRGVATYHSRIGIIYFDLGQFESSIESLQASASLFRQMITEKLDVAVAENELSRVLLSIERAQLGEKAFSEWAEILQQPAEKLPAILEIRGLEFCRRGDFEAAAQSATKLCELENCEASQLYNAACVFSRCADSIHIDEHRTTPGESAKRKMWLDQALDSLRRAVNKGWNDTAHLQTDPDLDAIRETESFRLLIIELEQGAILPEDDKSP